MCPGDIFHSKHPRLARTPHQHSTKEAFRCDILRREKKNGWVGIKKCKISCCSENQIKNTFIGLYAPSFTLSPTRWGVALVCYSSTCSSQSYTSKKFYKREYESVGRSRRYFRYRRDKALGSPYSPTVMEGRRVNWEQH